MIKLSYFGLAAIFALLSSCGTTGSIFGADDGPTEEGRFLGEYLAGSYAYNLEDTQASANYYSRAFARAPENAQLGAKAILAALASGDYVLARSLSVEVEDKTIAENALIRDQKDELNQSIQTALRSGDQTEARTLARQSRQIEEIEPVARLILAASDMQRAEYSKAAERLAIQPSDPKYGVMIAYLEAWAEYGAGKSTEALNIFSSVETDGYFNIISTLQKAKIYGEQGDEAQARSEFQRAESSGLSRIQTLMSKAQFLDNQGKSGEALEALRAFDAEIGGVETGPVRAAINRLEAGQPLGLSRTPAQHAADTLIDPAGSIFAQQGGYDTAELYLRIALMLDPDNENAKLWLGNILERMDRSSDAERIYEAIPKDSDYSVSAQLSYSNLLFREDEDEQAVNVLTRLYAEHPAIITREALATAYLIKEDYANALPVYNALVQSLSPEQLASDTSPLYHRGICYERLDRWAEAEADFQRVLEIDPDSADALNYLGYTWVDRGENLDEAFDMIRRAVELEPDSGAIIDSLGWAHFQLGQYSEARIYLEDASEKSPGSATIIDHLGDVYWKLGRFLEASYQWKHALDLDPTEEETARIKVKLESGYEAAKDMPNGH